MKYQKMWSDDLDKKIREAAGSETPAFNEKAWDKMLPLLDEHLPREKKRRWVLLLILSFMAAGLGVFFITQRGSITGSSKTTATTIETKENKATIGNIETAKEKTETIKENVAATGSKSTSGEISDGTKGATEAIAEKTNTDRQTKDKVITPADGSTNKNVFVGPTEKNIRNDRISAPLLTGAKKSIFKTSHNKKRNDKENSNEGGTILASSNTDIVGGNSVKTSKQDETVSKVQQNSPIVQNTAQNTGTLDTTVAAQKKVAADKVADTSAIAVAKPEKKIKSGSSKGNKLSFNFSIGPDISGVGLGQAGKMKIQYGVGVGYEINDKLSVRTGFYASRKIYSADSADYHPPHNFWSYLSNLQTVDANCLVYEIPVNVMYQFSPRKKGSWFASAGLSSYIMKKETYVYNYKDTWGSPQSYEKSYYSDNSHWFSVLSISGGYRYKFSERFSLLAEPYLKMPISGIGFGKVKLNSSGLLFTASLKPFGKKK